MECHDQPTVEACPACGRDYCQDCLDSHVCRNMLGLDSNPFDAAYRAAKVDVLEKLIATCKQKRQTLVTYVQPGWAEQEFRDEGFRGALAWVEGQCAEQINKIRGVLK